MGVCYSTPSARCVEALSGDAVAMATRLATARCTSQGSETKRAASPHLAGRRLLPWMELCSGHRPGLSAVRLPPISNLPLVGKP